MVVNRLKSYFKDIIYYFCGMTAIFRKVKVKEFIYQAIFLGLLFLTYAMDKHEMDIHFYDIIFFSFYVSVAFLINYVLIPRYFYTKKFIEFWITILLLLIAVYFLEEFVLEKVFVGGKRGQYISSFFNTIINIIPFIFMIVGYKMAWDTIKKQQELDFLKNTVKESELRFLKSQINPHFLFNNLNNLYAYAIENSPKTPTIILELSSVLRYMLYDCKEQLVPLSKELDNTKSFVGLNKLQIEERGLVSLNIKGKAEQLKIAPLILIVFIENAFKHSTASLSENIHIAIDIDISDQGIFKFSCSNNFSPNANNNSLSKGIGLANVKKRLQLLYPDNYQLEIKEVQNLYQVDLTIDLNA